MNRPILPPTVNYDIKIRRTDLSRIEDKETQKIIESAENKTICLFFCRISSEVLTALANKSISVSMVDTFSAQNLAIAKEFENDKKVIIFLTHMTYEQYGEQSHRIKMMLEQVRKEKVIN
jgi:hypothetical protein